MRISFFSQSYDLYEIKALRSGSWIEAPENIVIRNVDLSILKIKIINVLNGVCDIINLLNLIIAPK